MIVDKPKQCYIQHKAILYNYQAENTQEIHSSIKQYFMEGIYLKTPVSVKGTLLTMIVPVSLPYNYC